MYADIYGSDYEYARSRLRGSIVLWQKKPVWVCEVDNGGNSLVRTLWPDRTHDVKTKDLYIAPFPLGFINYGRKLILAQRKPSRFYKQGLTYDNVWYKGGSFGFETPHFVNTVMGKFPTVMTCIEEIICDETNGRAFSRDFALGKSQRKDAVKLSYKGNSVGHVKFGGQDNINFQLNEEHNYLQEVLEEAINA